MGETVDPPFPHDQRKPREHEGECERERERKRWKNRVCCGDDEDDENDDDDDDDGDGDDDYLQYYCTTNAHQLLQRVKFSRHRDLASPQCPRTAISRRAISGCSSGSHHHTDRLTTYLLPYLPYPEQRVLEVSLSVRTPYSANVL